MYVLLLLLYVRAFNYLLLLSRETSDPASGERRDNIGCEQIQREYVDEPRRKRRRELRGYQESAEKFEIPISIVGQHVERTGVCVCVWQPRGRVIDHIRRATDG